MTSEFDYFSHKRADKVYVSPRIAQKALDGSVRYIRIIDKIIDSPETWRHAKVGNELIIRTTPKGRQQIIAKIYEDTKGIYVLTIQRFETKRGNPHQISFSFIGDEIKKFREFLECIPLLDLDKPDKLKVTDEELRKVKEFLKTNPDVDFIRETIQHFDKSDIVTLAYRRKQLSIFEKLLIDPVYFAQAKSKLGKSKNEDVWQFFFEKNPWIFGYGLNFVFNSPLEGKKLEQVVQGASVAQRGKRADGLLKTRGIISSLCLVEIKTHLSELLEDEYRPAVWKPAEDLVGGIAQLQKNIQKSLESLGQKLETNKANGDPTGEIIYSYQPKSYLIIGNLSEFMTDKGVNIEKYSSFELFRKNLNNMEVITFDELYERAKFIVQSNELEQG